MEARFAIKSGRRPGNEVAKRRGGGGGVCQNRSLEPPPRCIRLEEYLKGRPRLVHLPKKMTPRSARIHALDVLGFAARAVGYQPTHRLVSPS